MTTFALVHGAWHGAWCWESLAALLRQAGHEVVAMDLPIEDGSASFEDHAGQLERHRGDDDPVGIMVRTADGFCWVALVNSGRTVSDDPTGDTLSGLDALMWGIREKVDSWGSDPL
jgi:hypothetical protein